MKKALVYILVLISIIVLVVRFGTKPALEALGIKEKSGIRVLSIPDQVNVYIDNQEVGKSPFEDTNMGVKELTVKLQKDDLTWQGKVKLISGTLTVVNRELAKDASQQAGEILTLEKGKGATIISNPSDAEVEIDGKSYGKTPASADIKVGEHTFVLSKQNYLKRSIKAIVPDGFNLTLTADLALSEADLTTVNAPVITQTPIVVVKSTPTGFLRVRDKASLQGAEVARVLPKDELVLLEEQDQWDKIRLPNGTEGFVSKSYVEKKTP